MAIFKPADEEPYAQANPKGFVPGPEEGEDLEEEGLKR